MLGIELKMSERKNESFTKVIQGPKETFTDFFLQILTSAGNRMMPNSDARQIIKSLTFVNANSQCKQVIRLLKARAVAIEE